MHFWGLQIFITENIPLQMDETYFLIRSDPGTLTSDIHDPEEGDVDFARVLTLTHCILTERILL